MKKLLIFVLLGLIFSANIYAMQGNDWVNGLTQKQRDEKLIYFARENRIEDVRALLEAGANPNYQTLSTSLYWAAINNNLEMAQLLLDNGAKESMNVQGQFEYTPLHNAVRRNNLEMVKLLLHYGAGKSVNMGDQDGYTPLHWAAMNNNKDIIGILLDNGANKTRKDDNNRTPEQTHRATEETRAFIRDYILPVKTTKSSRTAKN
jgi:ankyrin repeat protein